MASLTRIRTYHSIALLLPDGRVLSAGGTFGRASAEIYSPPYLFHGSRPTITSAPANVAYGQSFFVGTPDATSISKVTLITLSSVTHGFNMGQRISRPSFSQATGGLNVTAPSDPNKTPPGYYMLFILNSNGVPSVAKIVQINSTTPTPTPTSTPTPSPTPTPTPTATPARPRRRPQLQHQVLPQLLLRPQLQVRPQQQRRHQRSGLTYNGGTPFVNGTNLIQGRSYTVTAQANATTPSVAFKRDRALVYTDSAAPFDFTWTPTALGNHTFAATPWSSPNGMGTSGATVTVTFTVVAASSPTPTPTPTQYAATDPDCNANSD